MVITTSGYTTQSERFRTLLESSAEFYARKMMRSDLCENIHLDIVVTRDLAKKEGVEQIYGYCHITDYRLSRPREFEIELDAKKRITKMLLTLAHEMTHLKQFARLQLRNYDNGSTKWKGETVGRKREKKIGHRKLPWEVEAYKKEKELFLDLVNNTDILDDYMDGNKRS
jgi:hypothetical protein